MSENRNYNYEGKLTLKRSRVLKPNQYPKDDIIKWLFLIVGERRFTFFYRIKNPLKAIYNEPFDIQMSFIMAEIKNVIQIGKAYEVWRAEEPIGIVKIVKINVR